MTEINDPRYEKLRKLTKTFTILFMIGAVILIGGSCASLNFNVLFWFAAVPFVPMVIFGVALAARGSALQKQQRDSTPK